MLQELLTIAAITLIPFLELRASIPYGIITYGRENWLFIFIVAILANILIGIIIYILLDWIILILTKIRFVKRIYDKYIIRLQKKIDKGVVTYGILSVGLFIGIPLPGTGVYSGALVAKLLGMKKRHFFLATIIGVLMAGIIVTIVMLSGASALEIFIKRGFT